MATKSADTRDLRRLSVARGRLAAHINQLSRELVNASEQEYRDISYRIYVMSGRVDVLTRQINELRDTTHPDLDAALNDIHRVATVALQQAKTGGAVTWRAGLQRIIELVRERVS